MVCSEQDIIGVDKNSCNSSNVANTIMVQQFVRTSSEAANDYRKQISPTPRYKSKTSSLSQTETACSDVHSRSAQTSATQKETINVLNSAWRDGTRNKYKYIFRRWETFCSERNYNTMQINIDIVLEFLTLEYNRGLSYNAIRNVLQLVVTFHMKSDTIILSKSL